MADGSLIESDDFFAWQMRQAGNVVIAIGFTDVYLRQFFADVHLATTISPLHAMPEESNLAVFICRQPKAALEQAWPRISYLD